MNMVDELNEPSSRRMPTGVRDNLQPRQSFIYIDVADVSCNRNPFFRLVHNPNGTWMPRMGCKSERITSFWADFTILVSPALSRVTSNL